MIVQAMNVCNCVHALCGVKTEYGSFLLNPNALNQVLLQMYLRYVLDVILWISQKLYLYTNRSISSLQLQKIQCI